jgi:hypothetical protein
MRRLFRRGQSRRRRKWEGCQPRAFCAQYRENSTMKKISALLMNAALLGMLSFGFPLTAAAKCEGGKCSTSCCAKVDCCKDGKCSNGGACCKDKACTSACCKK